MSSKIALNYDPEPGSDPSSDCQERWLKPPQQEVWVPSPIFNHTAFKGLGFQIEARVADLDALYDELRLRKSSKIDEAAYLVQRLNLTEKKSILISEMLREMFLPLKTQINDMDELGQTIDHSKG